MKKILLATILTLVSSLSWANDYEILTYSGQAQDQVRLTKLVQERATRIESRAYQCTRTEPYQVRVCRDVRSTRSECRTTPGRRTCTTRRGRQVCRTTPGRRVCRNVPTTRRVCRYETRYRTVVRTCYRNVEVPYMRTVRDIEATVRFNFAAYQGAPNFNFGIRLDENGLIDVSLLDGNSDSVNIQLLEPTISRDGVYISVNQDVDVVIAQ